MFDQLIHNAIKRVREEKEVEAKDNVYFVAHEGGEVGRGIIVSTDPISIATEIQNTLADLFEMGNYPNIFNRCSVEFSRVKFIDVCNPFSKETVNGLTFNKWYAKANEDRKQGNQLFYHYCYDAWLQGEDPKEYARNN